jgi:tetratricopeptide (TPR) repeat protein
MSVPMHVWEPPRLQSTVGKQVVVSTVAGPERFALPIREKLLAMAPRDSGRQTRLVDCRELQGSTSVQLVSATDQEPNDLVLASIARREGADFLLRGEVMENQRMGDGKTPVDDSLTISWRLTSLADDCRGGGFPVTVDVESAIDRYPDLALNAGHEEVLATAAVRESYRLLTPSLRRDQIPIEIPYLFPGSHDVRRGNAAALAGRWGEAESIWLQVLQRYPAHVPAIHNLALAAAAGQDFSRAKKLARRAIRLHPSRLHQETLVWIESRQRDYHEAFGLPDPPEGWFVTSDSRSAADRPAKRRGQRGQAKRDREAATTSPSR